MKKERARNSYLYEFKRSLISANFIISQVYSQSYLVSIGVFISFMLNILKSI